MDTLSRSEVWSAGLPAWPEVLKNREQQPPPPSGQPVEPRLTDVINFSGLPNEAAIDAARLHLRSLCSHEDLLSIEEESDPNKPPSEKPSWFLAKEGPGPQIFQVPEGLQQEPNLTSKVVQTVAAARLAARNRTVVIIDDQATTGIDVQKLKQTIGPDAQQEIFVIGVVPGWKAVPQTS